MREDVRAGRGAALLLIAAGGAASLLAYGQAWVTVSARLPGLPAASRTVTGRDLQPGPGFLPLLLLAAVLALWATTGWWRRAVGLMVAIAGLAVAAGAVASSPTFFHGDLAVGAELAGTPTYHLSWWWLLAAVGGLVGTTGGVLVVLHGQRWETMSRRYERVDHAVTAHGPLTERVAWDLLDAGQDPTASPSPAPGTGTPGASGVVEGTTDARSGTMPAEGEC